MRKEKVTAEDLESLNEPFENSVLTWSNDSFRWSYPGSQIVPFSTAYRSEFERMMRLENQVQELQKKVEELQSK